MRTALPHERSGTALGWITTLFRLLSPPITVGRSRTAIIAALVSGFSFGNDSGSRPVGGSAIWTGAMTGADLEFQNAVQGDAAVTVDFERNNAGVAFTNIKDLGTRSGLPSMEWSGLAIGADGRFGASDIRATFYGSNHGEVGGVFERNNRSLARSVPSASKLLPPPAGGPGEASPTEGRSAVNEDDQETTIREKSSPRKGVVPKKITGRRPLVHNSQ